MTYLTTWRLRNRRLLTVAAAVGLLGPALVACGSNGDENNGARSAHCASMRTVTYATRTQPSDPLFAYWSVADKLGYFAEECIKSQIIHLDAGEQAVEAGQAELTVSGPDVLLRRLGQDNGKPSLIAIFNQVPRSHLRMATLPSSPINSLRDLRGKTVATLSNSFTGTQALKAQLKLVGIDPDRDVKIVNIPAGAGAVNALRKGDVDMLNYVDSQVVQFEQLLGQPLKIVPLLPEMADTSGPVWVARAADFAKNKELFTAYIRAYLKGYLFLNTNLRAATAIQIDAFPELVQSGQSRDQAIDALEKVIAARNESAQVPSETATWATPRLVGWNYKHSWQTFLDLYPDMPELADFEAAYNNELIEPASKFDHDAIVKQAQEYRVK
ncbi:ABC transporter substrate-binding protein [Micromonospora sp. NPDC005113]